MPGWNEVLLEIAGKEPASPLDSVRRKYLQKVATHTKRNVIAYYSGWLTKPANVRGLDISDQDMNSFMTTVHKLDRSRGLDLILHTPGGDIAATEAIVNYLRLMFAGNIRAIVPQLAMSAGTMISCACLEIIMGKQSSLGPIDPQLGGVSTHGVLEEFQTAVQRIKADPSEIPLWQQIIGQYHPTFLGDCQNAIAWSKLMVRDWLTSGMLAGNPNAPAVADVIVDTLSDHSATKSHSRHLNPTTLANLGLKVVALEADPKLQDLVLTTHHAFMHTFANSTSMKIVENQRGGCVVMHLPQQSR
ncbi:MAG: ATP-dependent Clp protease proteolytic subunit [Burkholderiaceae bacterium]